jgi:hypothetical protein
MWGFGRRAQIVGAVSAGLYAVPVTCLFLFSWMHPSGLGYEWIYPYYLTLPWSSFGGLGILLGLPLNAGLVYLVGAGLTRAISRVD